MTIYSWLWTAWVAMFLIVEFCAIKFGPPGSTLSAHVWYLIGTKAAVKTFSHWVWRAGVLALLAWSVPHFMTGWTWFRKKK